MTDNASELSKHWQLDPGMTFLNHGSFGACPTAVLAHQTELRARLERQPVQFLWRELEPLLIGQDPLEIEKHFTNMTGLQHPNMPTVSGVDIALWDLAGKALEVPVWRLLGGRHRERGRLYANLNRGTRDRSPEGFARAGGTEILQGTDIRVAGESAMFGVTEVQRGLFPMAGSAVRLRRQIPYAVAAEMLLTGEDLPARRAHELGLVNHVVPDGQALVKAKEIANRISENGPLAVKAILATLRETETLSESDAFEIETRYGMEAMTSEDAAEGPRAFLEKRKPVFKGR